MRGDPYFILHKLKELPPEYDVIRQLLLDDPPSQEDLAAFAYNIVSLCEPEIEDVIDNTEKAKAISEKYSQNVFDSLDFLMSLGMDPNKYTKSNTNAMIAAAELEDGTIGPQIMRYMLEKGGNPNQDYGDVSLFDHLATMMVKYGDCYESKVKCWMVLLAYGGVVKEERISLKILEDFDVTSFKEFEKYSYEVEESSDGADYRYKVFIFDEDKKNVAILG